MDLRSERKPRMVPVIVRPDTFEGRAADIFMPLFDLRALGWLSFPERRLEVDEVLQELDNVAAAHLRATGVHYRDHVAALNAAAARSDISTRSHLEGLLLIANGLCDDTTSSAAVENVLTFVDSLLTEIIYLNYLLEPQMEKLTDRIRASSKSGKKSGQISHEKAERWQSLLENELQKSSVVSGRTQGELCRYLQHYLAENGIPVSKQTLRKYLAKRHRQAIVRAAGIKK
jgi:hypothetical protein